MLIISKKSKKITYRELYHRVCEMANILNNNVKKGDILTIYMPLVPESIYAMIACPRIGAIHSVVFGGFSAESLKQRVINANSDFIIHIDEAVRSGERIPMKSIVNKFVSEVDVIRKVLVVRNTGTENISLNEEKDICYTEKA